MISFIIGELVDKQKGKAVILTNGGVGYGIHVKNIFFLDLKLGQEIKLYTYLKVSENSMDLYGFELASEKDFFEILISVKGVGPKGALNILSLGSIEEIRGAIGRGDVAYLTQVSGIGKKTAERLVVELKSKLKNQDPRHDEANTEQGEKMGQVIEGLVALGYSKDEARQKVKDLPIDDYDVAKLLKMALRG